MNDKLTKESIIATIIVLVLVYFIFFQGRSIDDILHSFTGGNAQVEIEEFGDGAVRSEIPSDIDRQERGEGFAFIDVSEGTGALVDQGSLVVVDYVGTLEDGSVFDTSLQEGRVPFEFTVGSGGVIPGFERGVLGMREGGIRIIRIPSDLGYGDAGTGNIPGGATLYFQVTLIQTTPAQAGQIVQPEQ